MKFAPKSAGDYVMPFGMYKGKTLDNIASSHSGLRWLDWGGRETRR